MREEKSIENSFRKALTGIKKRNYSEKKKKEAEKNSKNFILRGFKLAVSNITASIYPTESSIDYLIMPISQQPAYNR